MYVLCVLCKPLGFFLFFCQVSLGCFCCWFLLLCTSLRHTISDASALEDSGLHTTFMCSSMSWWGGESTPLVSWVFEVQYCVMRKNNGSWRNHNSVPAAVGFLIVFLLDTSIVYLLVLKNLFFCVWLEVKRTKWIMFISRLQSLKVAIYCIIEQL